MKPVIYWDKKAFLGFSKELSRLHKRSYELAIRTEADIISAISRLAAAPLFYPEDRFKRQNTGKFRSFELHRLRVSYFAGETEIVILRVLHWRRKG